MKRFLIEILITSIIVFITRKISDTYICGGIAGIISTYIYLVVDEILKRLEDTEFNEAFKKAKENNKEIRKIKRKIKVLGKIRKIAKRYDLELTRTEFNNEKVLLIKGIMEDK